MATKESTSTAQKSENSSMESRTIEPVPRSERHGKASSQFTLWLGANLQITAIVNGTLGVLVGADPIWAIIGMLIGNVLAGAVTALHSAQGPKLGLPQMISSRAQFGVYGAILPLVLTVLMYIGFAGTGTVLSGQAINRMFGMSIEQPVFGIIVFGVITAIIAVLGYKYIHKLGSLASWAGLIMLAYLGVRMFTKYDVFAAFQGNHFHFVSFLLCIALGAGWQLTFGPYVADYSRYLPFETSSSSVFWWTLGGLVCGAQISMIYGVLLASLPTAKGQGFITNQVGFLGTLGGGGFIAIIIYLVITIGKLTVNTLNAYGGCMTIMTTMSSFGSDKQKGFNQKVRTGIIVAFILASVIFALVASADFLASFKSFILTLLMAFTPWTAINLIDYYLISKERVDIPALYDPNGRYGKYNVPALTAYIVGILAQIPFLNSDFYTGPMTKVLGGADISWIVGLIVPAIIYWAWGRTAVSVPEHTIYFYDDEKEPVK